MGFPDICGDCHCKLRHRFVLVKNFWSRTIAIHQTNFRGYKLFYENKEATQSMIRAADDFPSFFSPRDDFPLIIDCGANIGVSVLEWKYRWPTSRIICFEPDPFAFEILETNIKKNDLPNVLGVCAAISNQEGQAIFHGQINRGADSRGNSLRPQWGRRPDSTHTMVQCVRLSPYLADHRVSFLKLDIEGMEEAVLEEISPLLGNVDAAYVEVHDNDQLSSENTVERIEHLLVDAKFQIETEHRFQPHALPKHLRAWQSATNATQSQILCWR